MTAKPDRPRILLAVTEASRADPLWRRAMDLLAQADGDIVAVFVADEHLERAARLPFTREISSVSGELRDFTQEHARRLVADAARRARIELDRLAESLEQPFAFEILDRVDRLLIDQLVGDAPLTAVVPPELRGTPIYLMFESRRCKIVVVDHDDSAAPDETTE